MPREFAVIVFGATGYTGKLIAAHLLKYSGDVKFAIAGRSKAKLEAVKAELQSANIAAAQLPIIIADSTNDSSLAEMAKRTEVVLTATGPYSLYGRPLVKACVEAGTDYCDLTGEISFVREMVQDFHEAAVKSGARIVTCCGFDSVPSDIGTLVAVDALRQRSKQTPFEGAVVESFVTSMNAGVSGGTIASLSEVFKDSANLRDALNPYALCKAKGNDRNDTVSFVKWVPSLKRWASPFIMASINAKVVRRSNEVLNFKYGSPDGFSYQEHQATSRGAFFGFFVACVSAIGFLTLNAALLVPPLRKFLIRLAPQPGEGPSPAQLERGHAQMRFNAQSRTNPACKVAVEFACRRDPGYADTSVMIAETALALASSRGVGFDGCLKSGVLTPASAVGHHLTSRLQRFNITWTQVANP